MRNSSSLTRSLSCAFSLASCMIFNTSSLRTRDRHAPFAGPLFLASRTGMPPNPRTRVRAHWLAARYSTIFSSDWCAYSFPASSLVVFSSSSPTTSQSFTKSIFIAYLLYKVTRGEVISQSLEYWSGCITITCLPFSPNHTIADNREQETAFFELEDMRR
jgi:hypothetical protein